VSHQPTTAALSRLKTVLCYSGYLTPAHEGVHCLGASFIRHDTSPEPRLGERQENLQKLGESLPECHWHQELAVADESRVSIRATLRDHLPLAGRLDRENTPPLWLLAGLGSRGLCSAPLLGELLASELCNEPLPLPVPLLDALHPSRFAKQ
jgi:tRNA 5-methylaminomethyl-2-thiouridine biosynthesis bifunctional protein